MTSTSSEKLDDLTPHQLIDEIKQIAEQYSREVTTARRTWPKSVRDRILALARLGVPRNRIARECGIPATTVFLWCEKVTGRKRRVGSSPAHPVPSPQARFLALSLGSDTSHSNTTVGMGIEPEKSKIQTDSDTGFQIVLPGGIEVRGLSSIDQILALYRGCRA
jgi:transposase-like protein